MFFKQRKVELKDLPLEQLMFTSEDLFCLLGGCDLAMFACSPASVDLDAASGPDRPQEGVWFRALLQHFGETGVISPEGEPNPELKAALAPLCRPGISIADGPMPSAPGDREVRNAAVAISDGAATAIVSEKTGFFGGQRLYRLVPFGEDQSTWAESFAKVFKDRRPVADAPFEAHLTSCGDEAAGIIRALDANDPSVIRTWSARKGIDPEPLLELAEKTSDLEAYPPVIYFVDDYRGCDLVRDNGWFCPGAADGPVKKRIAYSYPQFGCAYSECLAAPKSYPPEWTDDPELVKGAGFASVDFYRGKTTFDTVKQAFPYPDEEKEQ